MSCPLRLVGLRRDGGQHASGMLARRFTVLMRLDAIHKNVAGALSMHDIPPRSREMGEASMGLRRVPATNELAKILLNGAYLVQFLKNG